MPKQRILGDRCLSSTERVRRHHDKIMNEPLQDSVPSNNANNLQNTELHFSEWLSSSETHHHTTDSSDEEVIISIPKDLPVVAKVPQPTTKTPPKIPSVNRRPTRNIPIHATRINVSEESLIERHNLLLKVEQYKQTLPHKLESIKRFITTKALDKMSNEQLKIKVNEIEHIINTSNSSAFYLSLFFTGCMLYEKFLTKTGILCMDGFTSMVSGNQEIIDLINKIIIEKDVLTFLSPEKHLLILILQLTMSVHYQNIAKQDTINMQMKPEVENELNEVLSGHVTGSILNEYSDF